MKLTLRPVNLKDAKVLAEWFNDKENTKHMSSLIRGKDHSEKSVAKEIRGIDLTYERLFMVLDETGKPVGHGGIDDIDSDDMRGEIFYIIDKSCQGKGYGTKIAELLVNYAFLDLKINSLFASATIENRASLKILEKIGFSRIGVAKEYNRINGKFVDEVMFGMTRKDYDAHQAKKHLPPKSAQYSFHAINLLKAKKEKKQQLEKEEKPQQEKTEKQDKQKESLPAKTTTHAVAKVPVQKTHAVTVQPEPDQEKNLPAELPEDQTQESENKE